MQTLYKLIFTQNGKEIPDVALESARGTNVKISFGYDICDFIASKIKNDNILNASDNSTGHVYNQFGFAVADVRKAFLFLKIFFIFGETYKAGISQDLFEAYLGTAGALVPRVSYNYLLPIDVIEVMAKLSIEDSGEFMEFDKLSDLEKIFRLKMKQMSAYMALKNTNSIITNYHCDNLQDIIAASVYHILKLGYTFKKCNNCKKWFVPYTNKNEEYCERISSQYQDKTCKEANILIKSNNRIKNDEVQRLQKRIYNLYRSSWDAGYIDDNKFMKFKEDKEIWKAKLKNGTKTRDEYVEWLKTHYARKYSTKESK